MLGSFVRHAARSTKAAGSAARKGAQSRSYGVIDDLKSQVEKGLESNPELKKQFEELSKKGGEAAKKATEQAQAAIKEAAAAGEKAGMGDVGQKLRDASKGAAVEIEKLKAAAAQAAQEQMKAAQSAAASAASQGKAAAQEAGGARKPEAGGTGAAGAAGAAKEDDEGKAKEGGAAGAKDSEEGAAGAAGGEEGAKVEGESLQQKAVGFFGQAAQLVREELSNAFLPQEETKSALRRRGAGASAASAQAGEEGAEGAAGAAASSGPGPGGHYGGRVEGVEDSDRQEVVLVSRSKSAWDTRWGAFTNNPFFQQASKAADPFASKAREVADDMRDKWETSDSPFVYWVEDMKEKMFGETEQGVAMKEIRTRDPNFTTSHFLDALRHDAREVLSGYLKGDEALLAEMCAPEMMERFTAQFQMWKQEGQVPDPNILNVEDMELHEVKMHQGDPIVVVRFFAQQINCVRDTKGTIIEGEEDDIRTFFYVFFMQLQSFEEAEEAGHPPAWMLRHLEFVEPQY